MKETIYIIIIIIIMLYSFFKKITTYNYTEDNI